VTQFIQPTVALPHHKRSNLASSPLWAAPPQFTQASQIHTTIFHHTNRPTRSWIPPDLWRHLRVLAAAATTAAATHVVHALPPYSFPSPLDLGRNEQLSVQGADDAPLDLLISVSSDYDDDARFSLTSSDSKATDTDANTSCSRRCRQATARSAAAVFRTCSAATPRRLRQVRTLPNRPAPPHCRCHRACLGEALPCSQRPEIQVHLHSSQEAARP
jgi:hypothetical protein